MRSLLLLSLLVLTTSTAATAAVPACETCSKMTDPTQYLSCMQACLSDQPAAAETPEKPDDSRLASLKTRARDQHWRLSVETDAVAAAKTAKAAKNAVHPLSLSGASIDAALIFSAKTDGTGGLYLSFPDLSGLSGVPMLSFLDNITATALAGKSLTVRVDKHPARTLNATPTPLGLYLESSEELLTQMTDAGLLTLRLSGALTNKTDLYFDLRGFSDAAQWVQLSVGGISRASPVEPPVNPLDELQKFFEDFTAMIPRDADNKTSNSPMPLKKENSEDIMKF